MTVKAIFYHAGCPVCVDAEQGLAKSLDPTKYQLEIVHLADSPDRISEAKQHGVKSVPALMLESQVFHINFGADLSDLQ